jgi:hypothetical protein
MQLVGSYSDINFYKVNLSRRKFLSLGIATSPDCRSSCFELCWHTNTQFSVSTGFKYHWTSDKVTLIAGPSHLTVRLKKFLY